MQTTDFLLIKKHFDPDFYLAEYPDVSRYNVDPLVHFCRIGWKEGRNPNPFFDTTSYLIDYPDIVRAKVNPYFHFLEYGRFEGRLISPSFTPSVRSRLALGHAVHDWVSLLQPFLDMDYYTENLPLDMRQRVHPVAHFAFRGWREGLSLNRERDIHQLSEQFQECAAMMVNPMVAQIEFGAGRYLLAPLVDDIDQDSAGLAAALGGADVRSMTVSQEFEDLLSEEVGDVSAALNEVTSQDDELGIVGQGIAAEFYLSKYPDVAAAKIDPGVHYHYTGWMEGRNPTREFDTTYYLQANHDVRDAGINPFWHYLVAGKAEGRPGRRPGGYLREVLDSARSPQLQKMPYAKDFAPMTQRGYAQLRAAISPQLGHRKTVISFSHDCYVRVVGGTQIFIADEEKNFRSQDATYIHLSPLFPQTKLVEKSSDFPLVVTCQGKVLGWLTLKRLQEVLGNVRPSKDCERDLIVHCALGWSVDDIIGIAKLFKPTRSLYWLHDYSSMCPGYNLMRNNMQFCGAPSPESLACRVCVYGQERPWHLKQMEQLFSKIRFDVVAPSTRALEIWSAGSSLPCQTSIVHPHWQTVRAPVKPLTRRHGKPRLGFIGYPTATKGWHHFVELATDDAAQKVYDFYQFSSPKAERLLEAKFVSTEVTADDRFVAVRVLDSARIDAVLILSPWPETFSFVLFEALAAGCQILCLADSGNVAHVVQERNAGKVFDTIEDLKQYLLEDGATWLKSARKSACAVEIKPTGTSATLLSEVKV